MRNLEQRRRLFSSRPRGSSTNASARQIPQKVRLIFQLVVGLIVIVIAKVGMDSAYGSMGNLELLAYDVQVPASNSTAPASPQRPRFVAAKPVLSDLLKPFDRGISAEKVWDDLIVEGAALMADSKEPSNSPPGIVMEIGMYRATQCLQAAKAGLEAHCVEPSAINFRRVEGAVRNYWDESVTKRVHLHHTAAGSVTGRKQSFFSGGGSGDRIGNVDVWNMEQRPKENPDPSKMTEIVETRMDDILLGNSPEHGAYVVKVDTQGFEPHVLAGFNQSLQSHKIQYLLMEYWPKGIDLMTASIGDCSSVKLLQALAGYGYRLYQLPIVAHPRATRLWYSSRFSLPLDDIEDNCRWYYDLEKKHPVEGYKMGYWSDVLAVSPKARLPSAPKTTIGGLLQTDLSSTS